MKAHSVVISAIALALALTSGAVWGAPQYVASPPLAQVLQGAPAPVKDTGELTVPLITWGGDIATILANGNSASTAAGSIFAKRGLKLKLVRMDDFKKQAEAFIKGETPFLRGTMGMINMAAEALSKDPRVAPVVVYQMTWSVGGDCLVVKQGIQAVRDLKGKTIALQAYGPHVDYLGTVLKDAGLSMNDVKIKWTPDVTGTENTPGEAFHQPDADAAFVIIPDGLALTSKGTVGTGAEGSVRGARILMSTRTASRVIADVYAVRSDYFQARRQQVEVFVNGLLTAEQQLKRLFADRKNKTGELKALLSASAQILLDSPQATADAEALYGDCEFVGFGGNVKFFGDANWPRNFANLTESIQSSFVTGGLLGKKVHIEQAKWEYDRLRTDLTGVEDVASPRFKMDEVAKVVEKRRAVGKLGEAELFSFEILFQPNQNDFPAENYAAEFAKVVELASTYGGAVIVVEGHSDPLGYLRRKKEGETEMMLKRTEQAAKNLSLARAMKVRDGVIESGKKKGASLDLSQFTVIGHGINQPKSGLCGGEPCAPRTKEEWLSNMRVVFRMIQVEAEDSVFKPLD
ncbi:MAG: ABC transporter substrate-binding protein [Pseudomonadota bacterium]